MGAAGNIAAAVAALSSGAGLYQSAVSPPDNLDPARGVRVPETGVTLGISREALALISQAGAFAGGSLSGLAARTRTGVGSTLEPSNLSNKLVDVAVLAALTDTSRDKDEEARSRLATAVIMAAAVQAYQQVASAPGMSVLTPVIGAGVSISISGGAGSVGGGAGGAGL